MSAKLAANWVIGEVAAHLNRDDLAMTDNPITPASNQQGDAAYRVGVENGISLVRDRDEVYLRVRYTF